MPERARDAAQHAREKEPSRPARPAPSTEDPLLALQRTAGNQAVVSMMEGAATDSGPVVRRTGTGGPATTAAPDPAGPAKTDDDAAVADPGGYLRSIGSSWDEARRRYKSGKLGWVAGGDDKGKLKPEGRGMNALLAFRLQATVLKKSDDPASNSPMEQVLPQIRAKQMAEMEAKQRALHEQGVQNVLPPPKPLEWNYGAGSGTATSDIDVNLSGDATEYAVSAFNELFRSAWGGKESGSVFDVNVYARDYLPESGAFSLVKAGREVQSGEKEAGGAIATGDAAWGARGVAFETSLNEGSAVAKKASESQEVYSLLKTRKDMSFVDWQRFKIEQLEAFGKDEGAARDKKQAAFSAAETKYEAREAAITAKVAQLDAKAKLLLTESRAGAAKAAEASASDKRLAAENALYEEKLQQVASVRSKLAVAKELLLAGQRSSDHVEEVSAELQGALHEAASYANEAYITGATVLHVVGNLQLLKGSESLSIGLSGADYLASANEQVGFIFDDLHREASIEGGLLKAGKYISRLGHAGGKAEAAAARKATPGSKPPAPLANPSCAQVEKYGKQLMEIKEKVKPADQAAALARVAVDGWTLSGKPLQQVKTEILRFQSKVQTLAGKV